uniref:Ig-like domain-containing protein n=1 Tax=Salarias fasciatus TaxID=181472 RepID=A0A672G057_SALFA
SILCVQHKTPNNTGTRTSGNLPASRLRAIWHHVDSTDQRIYYDDKTMTLDSFKHRTRLLGDLGKNNCTLELTEVKNHDNGPFCFRIELVRREDNKPTKDKFSFYEECISLNMLTVPTVPTLTHSKTAHKGRSFTITCTVAHTCPSRAPKITWNLENPQVTVHHKDIRYGNWEVQSILTIIPEEEDDHREITCSAQFNGGRNSSQTMTLYVKRAVTYNHIIIPTVVVIGTAVAFGLICVLMARKYKQCISELQNQEGRTKCWDRV